MDGSPTRARPRRRSSIDRPSSGRFRSLSSTTFPCATAVNIPPVARYRRRRTRISFSAVADGIRGKRSIVVLEPDAVSAIDCLNASARDARNAILRGAVRTLMAAGAWVYIDAGHWGWHSRIRDRVPPQASRHRRSDRVRIERLELRLDRKQRPVRRRGLGPARREALHHRHEPKRSRPGGSGCVVQSSGARHRGNADDDDGARPPRCARLDQESRGLATVPAMAGRRPASGGRSMRSD